MQRPSRVTGRTPSPLMWVCAAVAVNPRLGLRSITRCDRRGPADKREKQPSSAHINSTVSPRLARLYSLHTASLSPRIDEWRLDLPRRPQDLLPFSSKTPPRRVLILRLPQTALFLWIAHLCLVATITHCFSSRLPPLDTTTLVTTRA